VIDKRMTKERGQANVHLKKYTQKINGTAFPQDQGLVVLTWRRPSRGQTARDMHVKCIYKTGLIWYGTDSTKVRAYQQAGHCPKEGIGRTEEAKTKTKTKAAKQKKEGRILDLAERKQKKKI
jgi:hypothetical protein